MFKHITDRFVRRLGLYEFPNHKIKINGIVENKNYIFLKEWTELKKDKPVLQLYHALKPYNLEEITKSIMNKGFIIGSARNKGLGVYLANHSRYSAFWAGSRSGVIVCNVIYDPRYVKRYRSEIKSPIYDSEYVVENPKLIFPKYLIKYDLNVKHTCGQSFPAGYVEPGSFGCEKCDRIKEFGFGSRCDCPHESYDAKDLVDI